MSSRIFFCFIIFKKGVHIRQHICWQQYICDRPISANNIGRLSNDSEYLRGGSEKNKKKHQLDTVGHKHTESCNTFMPQRALRAFYPLWRKPRGWFVMILFVVVFYHWGNQGGTFAVNMGWPSHPWGGVGGQWMYESGHGPTCHLLAEPLYSKFDFLAMEW